MLKKIAPKVITIALVGIIGIELVQPLVVRASLSSQLGTNTALGSPLINENFSTDDYNKYEMLCFGVFCSNFVTPLVDDYKSAFASGQGGSDGRGRQALQFAGGNDSSANEALQSMLDYVITAQTPLKQVSVQYTYKTYSNLVEQTSGTYPEVARPATINDLLLQLTDINGGGSLSKVQFELGSNGKIRPKNAGEVSGGSTAGTEGWDPAGPFVSMSNPDAADTAISLGQAGITSVSTSGAGSTYLTGGEYDLESTGSTSGTITNTRLVNVTKTCLPTFTVRSGDGTQSIVLYDFNNGWDLQMFAAWMANVDNGDFGANAEENMAGMSSSNSPLYMDTFGNIVTQYNGRYIVIIPGCANQHLTKNNTINLLNSVLLNGSYTSMGLQAMQEQVESIGYSDSVAADILSGVTVSGDNIGVKGDSTGQVWLSFDTDDWLFKAASNSGGSGVNFGDGLVQLAEASINRNRSSNLNLRINISKDAYAANTTMDWAVLGVSSDDGWEAMTQMVNIAADVVPALMSSGSNSATVIDYMHTNVAEEDPLFKSAGYIVVSETKGSVNTLGDIVVNSALKWLDGTDTSDTSGITDMPNASELKSKLLNGIDTGNNSELNVAHYFLTGNSEATLGDKTLGPIARRAILNQNQIKLKKKYSALELLGIKVKDIQDIFAGDGVTDLSTFWTSAGEERRRNMVQRVQKVYLRNDNMVNAENVLCIRAGTEFAAWTPWIYITYLEAYGIKGDTSAFNEALFNGADWINLNSEELFSGVYMSDEEKQNSINEYTYLMLHPKQGREYRAGIILDWISDILYNSYISIVYGENSYNYAGGLGSTSSSGFLKFNNYEDNILTGWFIQGYIKYAIWIVGLGAIAIIVVALLMKRKIGWMLLSLLMLVTIVLIMPSVGDLTPTLASGIVQDMFSDHVTYWALSESIANQALESSYVSSKGGVTANDVAEMKEYMSMLNTVQLDRTLMIKQDISKKVTKNSTGIFSTVQANASTRWLLPRLMSQFNADDGNDDYVSITLGDMYDNWSNIYWVYVPGDRVNTSTINASSQETGNAESRLNDVSKQDKLWGGYESTAVGTNWSGSSTDFTLDGVRFKAEGDAVGYNLNGVTYVSPYADAVKYETWKSNSRGTEGEGSDPGMGLSHTQYYMIDFQKFAGANYAVPNEREALKTKEGRENLAARYDFTNFTSDSSLTDSAIGAWNAALVNMSGDAENYRPSDVGAKQDYGYLWVTENPGSYFYQVVKETYAKDNTSFSKLVGALQGGYIQSSATGQEERISSLHFSNTGDVKDILDLEELFTNVIPYVYTVQSITCGTDGANGIFGNMKLDNYGIYSDNYASWLFRSNWVTKMYETTSLADPVTIRYGGVNYAITNPLLPDCYPKDTGRPMVFSRAQQVALGLVDADMTVAELKCIQVNEAVARKWTLLLNYVNTSGMTMEVIARQMALDALLEFNKEFNGTGLSTSTTQLYPVSVDLRYLSFDSVMKMLLLNSSGNASYVYGDTMKGVIENSDMISAILLLVAALLSQTVIPLVRDVFMGVVFYLGLWSVLCNIFAGGKAKLKTCAGYGLSNGVYLVLTCLYYLSFSALMSMSSADEVLRTSNVTIDNGSPTAEFIIIIVVSIVYIVCSWKLVKFVFKNYRDMGMEVYMSWGAAMAGKISDGISNLKTSFENRGNDVGGGYSGAAVAGGVAAGAVAGAAGAATMINGGGDEEDTSAGGEDSLSASGYNTQNRQAPVSSDEDLRGSGEDIDAAVERGRNSRQAEAEAQQEPVDDGTEEEDNKDDDESPFDDDE